MTTSTMRDWPQSTRVCYLNALRKAVAHRCPVNVLGVPLVSDFDLLTADDQEKAEAMRKVEECKS